MSPVQTSIALVLCFVAATHGAWSSPPKAGNKAKLTDKLVELIGKVGR
jgi:hypothetical protein